MKAKRQTSRLTSAFRRRLRELRTERSLTLQQVQDPRVRERPRTRDGMTMWPLTRRGSTSGPRPYKINISPDRRTSPDVLPVHQGLHR